MPRRKLNAEERHAKQLAKMQENKATNTYIQKPSIKEIVLEEAKKQGYKVSLEKNVLYFLYEKYDEAECENIRKWLLDNYGQDEVRENPFKGLDETETKEFTKTRTIPFSYGFKKNNSLIFNSNEHKSIEDDYELDELER